MLVFRAGHGSINIDAYIKNLRIKGEENMNRPQMVRLDYSQTLVDGE